MARKHCDGALTRAQDRALRNLLRVVEERLGPADSGRLLDAMQRYAHGETPGVAAETAVAFQVWEQFSDRATCRAWIESHRTNPSTLALQRREQITRKASALEQAGFDRGVAQGSGASLAAAKSVVERTFHRTARSLRATARALERRADGLLPWILVASAEGIVLCSGTFVMSWLAQSPTAQWTYVFGVPALAILFVFDLLRRGVQASLGVLVLARVWWAKKAEGARARAQEQTRLSRRLLRELTAKGRGGRAGDSGWSPEGNSVPHTSEPGPPCPHQPLGVGQ